MMMKEKSLLEVMTMRREEKIQNSREEKGERRRDREREERERENLEALNCTVNLFLK